MTRPVFPRILCLAAASVGFLTQGILPAVHARRVAAEEAVYHAMFPAALGAAALAPDRSVPHEHHDAAGCFFCSLSLRSGGAAPVLSAAPAVLTTGESLPAGAPVSARAAELLHPSGRGPPASV